MTKYDPTEEMQKLVNTHGLEKVRWQVAVFNARCIFESYSTKDLAYDLLEGRVPTASTVEGLLRDLGIEMYEDISTEDLESYDDIFKNLKKGLGEVEEVATE